MRETARERRPRLSRMERQAHRWAMLMADDPEKYEAGLSKWIGGSADRLAVYNRVARATRAATRSAAQLYVTTERPTSRLSASPRSIWVFAALLVGLTAAIVGVLHSMSANQVRDTPIASITAFDAPLDRAGTVTLADGSQVRLHAGGHIDVQFSPAQRQITLKRGQALFSVAHAQSRPFVVMAGGGRVTAKGTVFEVSLANEVIVRLIRGAIDVALPVDRTHDHPAVHHLVAGGSTRFIAVPDGSPNGLGSSGPKPKSAFATKVFDDVMVSDVIDQTNQISTTKIQLADPTIATRKVVLQLQRYDATDVADGLAAYFGLDVDRSRGLLILRRKT